MKKLVLIAVLFVAAGCTTMREAMTATPMPNEHIAENIRLGMSIKEFLRFAYKKANLEVLTTEETVYSLDVAGYSAGDGYTVAGKKLFHFDADGKLVKMESRDFREGGRYRRNHDR